MKKIFTLLFSALALNLALIGGASAEVLTVTEAKARGLVGEQNDGYIGVVTLTPSPDVLALVKETNDGRAAIYKEMAKDQRIEIFQVQQMAADKLYRLEKKGNYVQDAGSWIRKQ